MSNALNDRMKNEYSTSYVLILRSSNFYPKIGQVDNEEIENKVIGSFVPGIDNTGYEGTQIDPFRQCLGKFWSFTDSSQIVGNTVLYSNGVNFYDSQGKLNASFMPYDYREDFDVVQNLKFEDVSHYWSDFIQQGSSGALNLSRKATRVKIFFDKPDLLQNRLGMLSLITDMGVKNKSTAYYVDTDAGLPQEITFPKSSSGYNYTSTFSKDDIIIPFYDVSIKHAENDPQTFADAGTEAAADLAEAKASWTEYTLEALNQAVEDGHLNSFYNFTANTYEYTNLSYSDHVFRSDLPMSPRAISLSNTLNQSTLFCDIKPRYNYYSRLYETGTAKRQVTIPNSGNQIIPFSERSLPLIYEVPIDTDETPAPLGEDSNFKFEKFGHSILNCGYTPSDEDETRNFNVVLDQESQAFLNKYENVKYQFPFYVDFKFSRDSQTAFTEIFNQCGITDLLLDTFITNVFNREVSARGLNVQPDKDSPIIEQNSLYYNPFDPDPSYSGTDTLNSAAPICQRSIYSINNYEDFYQIIPPTTTSDKEALGDDYIKQSSPGQLREFDLNLFLDSYMKFLSATSGAGSAAENESFATFKNEVIRPQDVVGNSKKFLSNPPEFGTSIQPNTSSITDVLKAIKLLGKYKKLVDQKMRTYEDILAKKKAYAETIFYRIQKVAVDSNGNPTQSGIVQNIWLPKPSSVEENNDIIKYIDTQVMYGQKYEYTIYEYKLVVGTKYGFHFNQFYLNYDDNEIPTTSDGKTIGETFIQSAAMEDGGYIFAQTPNNEYVYRDITYTPADNQTKYRWNNFFRRPIPEFAVGSPAPSRMAMFDVVCEADVKLIEVPFYKKTSFISDAPSLAPEVDILPLNGKKNEIKINFSSPSVDRELEPIYIDIIKDAAKFNNIRLAQDRNLAKASSLSFAETVLLGLAPPSQFLEPKLQFRADDYPIQYEVYRTTKPPADYTSFAGNKRTTLNAENNQSLIEKIAHNKKYYYAFRSIDVHGNPSNPSPVYQVEMVENSGVTYPVISIYDFPAQPSGLKSKPFRRYLKIDAETLQGLLNLKESGLDTQTPTTLPAGKKPQLGLREDNLFSDVGKTFKFRIKSKHTGKIVDLNVSFKERHKQPTEQILGCGNSSIGTPFTAVEASESGNITSPPPNTDAQGGL